MRYLSVCSGIEAATVAWTPLGWSPVAFSEIEPFPCAVLAHHYPDVPNLGDMTLLPDLIRAGLVEAPDILCGGTPCQAFSVAGLRKSLDDARGNLSLTFCEIADAIDHVRGMRGQPPSIIFWENVPGVLSTKDNAFGCFLGGLAGEDGPLEPPGGKWANAGAVYGPKRAVAWRVLDAQYFGLAQRRRRVFVVASARDGFDPAAVLFEFDGVRRDSPPRREAREVDPTIPTRSSGGGGLGTDFDCDGGLIAQHPCVTVAFHPTQDPISSSDGSTHALGCGSTGGQASVAVAQPVVYAIQAGALRVNPASGPDGVGVQADHAYTLEARAEVQAVALRGREGGATAELGDEVQNCLRASSGGGDKPHVLTAMQVRRLTPRECERLMGFPDDYTLVPLPLKGRQTRVRWASDSARYKALGNSWAVPVVRWIGERINAVEYMKGRK